MNTKEALAIVIDIATRWGENAEEGLPARISPEMVANDELWAEVVSEISDEFDHDTANEVRNLWKAIEVLTIDAMAPSGSIQRAVQGFGQLVRQHIALSDMVDIQHMADQARAIDDDDWGSQRQIDAENAFNIAAERLMTPQQIEFWEVWGEKATTDERIDEALAILEGRSAAFDRWEGGR